MLNILKLFMKRRSLSDYKKQVILLEILPIIDGIPLVYNYGTEGEINYMILDILGPSLEDLFSFCG